MAQREVPSEDGFLSRWSQRKQALREGKPLTEPDLPRKSLQTEDFKEKEAVAPIKPAHGAMDSVANESSEPQPEVKPPAPTLEDTRSLTPQSDFKPFMRADVSPEVKNAAMKQLFKDPHFNVMDMMDTYVDDYSKPDPLPPEMLRKMAVTKFLGFWKEEEEEAEKLAAEKKAREDAQRDGAQNVAKSEPEIPELTDNKPARPEQGATDNAIATASAEPNTYDHPDLQLQPDDAARLEAAVRSAR